MKNILTVSFCLFAAVAAFAEDYEVTVPLGETNRIDAAFVSALGSKNLVKKGRGVLWGSSAMANYTGKITVEAGAFMVSSAEDVGKSDANRYVEIQSGATLIVNTGAGVEGSAAANAIVTLVHFQFAGTGDDQWGAALYQVPTGSSQNIMFKGTVELTDDAVFTPSPGVGIKGGAFYMGGHQLTLRGHFEMSQVAVTHTESNPVGDIVVESGLLHFNSGRSGYENIGHPSGTITIKDGATLRLYGALQTPMWNLVLEEGSTFLATGSASEVAGANAASYNKWGGDVVWNTTVDSSILAVNGSYVTFKGKVSGAGTIRSNRGGTIVFEKPCAETLAVDTSKTRIVMPSVDNYWGHGGMLLAHRNDGKYDYIHSGTSPAGTTWSYCDYGAGPQLDRSFWQDIRTAETWGSIGYLWNRETTNVTWKLFVGCVYQSWVYVGNGSNPVYTNKRDSWGSTYDLTVNAGECVKLEVYTSNGSTYGGPRTDNDKLKLSGVIAMDPGNGYLFTTDTVDRATVVLENTTKAANLTFGNNSILDANGMPIELTDISGFAVISNTSTIAETTKICKLKGTWSVKASEIGQRQMTVLGACPVTFDNVTIAVDDVDAIPRTQKHWDLCSADSISGFPVGTVLKGAQREWKLVLSADGKTAGLDYVPKGIVLVVR